MAEHPIVVATDFSDSAEEAVRQADRWARARGLPLVACHAASDLEASAEAMATLGDRVESLTGRKPDELTFVVRVGEPPTTIVREAETRDATAIVVGSRGLTGLSRLVLGSVAERVTRLAHCPVLVAREPEPGVERRRILAGTDFSPEADVALRAAIDQAAWRGAELLVAHAIGLESPARHLRPPPELRARLGADASSAIEAALTRLGGKATPIVLEGDAGAALALAAETYHAELVVVGHRGRTGITRMALGSVAESVVRHAGCSVLVVRA